MTLAIGSVNVGGVSLASAQVGFLSFVNEGPGLFESFTYNPFNTTLQTHEDDEPFVILSP